MDDMAKVWGERIRARRQLLRMSQEALAAELGVSQATVSAWECGEHSPRHSHIPLIARALHDDPAVLFSYASVA